MKNATLYEKPKTPTYKSFCFELIFEKNDDRHLFGTSSEENKQEWVKLIQLLKTKELEGSNSNNKDAETVSPISPTLLKLQPVTFHSDGKTMFQQQSTNFRRPSLKVAYPSVEIPSYSSPLPSPGTRRLNASVVLDQKMKEVNPFQRFATSSEVLDTIETIPVSRKGSIIQKENPKGTKNKFLSSVLNSFFFIEKMPSTESEGFHYSITKELVDSEKEFLKKLLLVKSRSAKRSQSWVVRNPPRNRLSTTLSYSGSSKHQASFYVASSNPVNNRLLNLDNLMEEVREKWSRSLDKLPVFIDFPRIFSKIKCWTKDLELMELNYRQLEKKSSEIDFVFLKDLLETFATQLNEMDEWFLIHDNFDEHFKSVGDFSNQIRTFLFKYLKEDSRIWKLLKALCMSVIAPPYIAIKHRFQEKFQTAIKDDAGTWSISIIFDTSQIVVVHSKRAKEESNLFSFSWHLQLRFSNLMTSLDDVLLTLTDLKWNNQASDSSSKNPIEKDTTDSSAFNTPQSSNANLSNLTISSHTKTHHTFSLPLLSKMRRGRSKSISTSEDIGDYALKTLEPSLKTNSELIISSNPPKNQVPYTEKDIETFLKSNSTGAF